MRDLHRPGRSVAMGSRGAAATSHPLATTTAIEVLRSGGNAIDAAVTACSLQSVWVPVDFDGDGHGGILSLAETLAYRRPSSCNCARISAMRRSPAWSAAGLVCTE
jgi:hypothetical protein